jgi:hypothetical protein
VQEEDLNRFQAQVMKEELEKLGIASDIYDPLEDDLYEIGSKAKGYDFFLSLHLNASKGKEFYTCAMVHSKYAKKASIYVASKFAIETAKAIGNNVFSGTVGYPRGVMAAGLSVLNAAERSGCPCCILSELEFVDDEISNEPIKERIKKGMKAGAKVIYDYLIGEPSSSSMFLLESSKTILEETQEMTDINETMDVLEQLESIIDGIIEAKKDDDKITLADFAKFVPAMTKLPETLAGISDVKDELADLDAEEIKEIVEKMSEIVLKTASLFLVSK